MISYFLGFLAGLLFSAGYILGKKERPAAEDIAELPLTRRIAVTHNSAGKARLTVNPPAPLEDEEAFVPDDKDYNAREELFKRLKEENKIEYISIE